MSQVDAVLVDFHFDGLLIDFFVEFIHFFLEELALVLLYGVEDGFLLGSFGLVENVFESLVEGFDL